MLALSALKPIVEQTPVIIKQEPASQLLNTPVQLDLFEVAGGQSETVNKRTRRRGKSSPKKDVRISDSSTLLEFNQLNLFD